MSDDIQNQETLKNIKCRICGSKDIYCIQETTLVNNPWMIVHLAYCENCAKIIESFELSMIQIKEK